MTPTLPQNTENRRGWLSGLEQALPVLLGYASIAFAFGILAQKAGISALNTISMSVLVYAGSAQLIAVGLFAAGASAASVILTTFVVNLRHLLLSAALAPHLKRWRKVELAVFAYELTDETFVLHSTRFAAGRFDKTETFAINVSAQLSWVLGTGLGIAVGHAVTDIQRFALDYALPAMFIALLVMQLKNRVHIIVGALTGALATGLSLAGLGQWTVIVATILGASIGVLLESKWTSRPSS
ncbi:MAG: AzlC family ABC transporter permease [Chloroflexi bacterium]|nr:AzlC family ABC transporter permease [Chloroflexota bacterium]